jgi:hypothetical protein
MSHSILSHSEYLNGPPKNLADHVQRFKNSLSRAEKIYRAAGKRWSVHPQLVLWRLRHRVVEMMSLASIWFNSPPPVNETIGETIQKWRTGRHSSNISRAAIALGVRQETFSRAELEVMCAEYASEGAVKSTLRLGLDLGLLTQPARGQYSLTQLCLDEAFDRCIARCLDDNLVELARLIVMFDDLRRSAEIVGEHENKGKLGGADHRGLAEKIYAGVHDKELGLGVYGEVVD